MTSPSASKFASDFSQNLLFLVLWNLANTLPWLAMGLVYQALPSGALAWLVACLLVGISQWLILQRYIANIGNWPLATLAGGIIGFTGFSTYIFAMIVTPLLCGLSVGIAQWFVLKHKLTGAFWWIVSTTVGALIGLSAGYILAPLFTARFGNATEHTIFAAGIVIEIVSSLVTGCTMLWLLKRNANRKAVQDRSS